MAATRVAVERATEPAYAAFISYSRHADARLAPRMETALERFATPWYRLRGLEVFRDDSDLSSNPGLWSSLTGAIDHAAHLVLLASPAAAGSEWVGREVEYWLERHGPDRVLIVLTEGEIAWDDVAGDFDWERTTALPRVLSGAFAEEPRYTDLRFAAGVAQLSLRDARFRDAVADVAAPLYGRAKDDLIGDEVREHRRMLRIARAAGAALAVLAVAASVAAVLAIRAADSANRERDRATRVAQVATSRELAAQSAIALRDGELGGALGHAARAWRTAHTGEARDALLEALKRAPGVDALVQGPRTELAAVSGDRARVALLAPDNRVTVLDLGTRRPAARPLRLRVPVTPAASDFFAAPAGLALDADGDRLAVGYTDGSVDLWDVAAGRPRWLVERGREGPVDGGALPVFSADGTRLAWGSGARDISVWDGKRIRTLRTPEPIGFAAWNLALSSHGRVLAAAGPSSGDVALWRLGRAPHPRLLHGQRGVDAAAREVVVALGGGALAVGRADGRVRMWDAVTGRRLRTVRVGRRPIGGLAFSPRGSRLAVLDSRAVTLLDAAGARIGASPARTAERGATPVDESGRVATIGAGGLVVVRRPGTRAGPVARPLAGGAPDTPLAFDPTGRRIAALDRDYRLRLWDAASGRPAGAPLSPSLDPYVLRFLPDGRVLSCCGTGRGEAVRIWDARGGHRVVPGKGEPSDAAAGPHGRVVVARTVGDDLVVTGDGPSLTIPSGGYVGLLSDDGRWLSATTDAGTDIWSIDQRRRTASIRGSADAFSPVGPLVATFSGPGPIRLVDRATGRIRGTLGDDLEVADMEFSPDGRKLASVTSRVGAGGADVAALEVWDVASRSRIGQAPLIERAIGVDTAEIAFAPDGSRVVVSGMGAPLVLDLDVDDWAVRAARLAADVP